MSEYEKLRQKLLERMVSGEINRAEYDELIAEVTSHESRSSSHRAASNSESSMNQSIGDLPTHYQAANRLQPEDVLGKFKLLCQLGRGGMGEVWKAQDTIGEREVVIKVLPPELSGNRVELERVKDSFKKMHALNHENICPIYDLGQDQKTGFFLVMQFLNARTLSEYRGGIVKKYGKFPVKTVMAILQKVAAALDYAHANKVIHRDVKPENIMITPDGKKIWLIDFGLAAEIQSSLQRVSQVQMDRSGTYPYMAPEQWQGQYQNARTDQYSLAVVAYEMITGRLPYEGDRFILERCALNQPFPMVENASESMNRAFAQATAKDRKDRFETCTDFILNLAGIPSAPPSIPPNIPPVPKQAKTRSHSIRELRRLDYAKLSKLAETGNSRAQLMLAQRLMRGVGVARDSKAALGWIQKSVEQNDTMAFAMLGDLYGQGEVIKKDMEKALSWVMKSVKKNCPYGQITLGGMYLMGLGVPENTSEGLRLITQAVNQQCPDAQAVMGLLYSQGHGVEQDPVKAKQWLSLAVKQEDPIAQMGMGSLYAEGIGVAQDYEEARKWFEKSAGQGNEVAQFLLGLLYFYGQGVVENNTEAFKWFQESAENGDESGQAHLGMMYDHGHGVAQDNTLAFHWYQKAAEKGHSLAQHNLGCMYLTGQGIQKNAALAAKWITKAADQGRAESQTELAIMLINEIGMKKDDARAIKLLELAVQQDDNRAKHFLGQMYEAGRGVPQDDEEAVRLFLLAALAGRRVAQYDLGRMFCEGKGCKRDLETAVGWLQKSADQDYAPALEALEQIEKESSGWNKIKNWFK